MVWLVDDDARGGESRVEMGMYYMRCVISWCVLSLALTGVGDVRLLLLLVVVGVVGHGLGDRVWMTNT